MTKPLTDADIDALERMAEANPVAALLSEVRRARSSEGRDAARDEALEEAAKVCDGRSASLSRDGKVMECIEASKCATAIRSLASPSPADRERARCPATCFDRATNLDTRCTLAPGHYPGTDHTDGCMTWRDLASAVEAFYRPAPSGTTEVKP